MAKQKFSKLDVCDQCILVDNTAKLYDAGISAQLISQVLHTPVKLIDETIDVIRVARGLA